MPKKTEAASKDAAREPKVRRISNKIPRKTTKEETSQKEETAQKEEGGVPSPKPEDTSKPDPKRGNRRRRGKGKSVQKEAGHNAAEETISLAPEEPEPRPREKDKPESSDPQGSRPQQQKPRRKPDPDKVAKNAWKIFLAEVSEEGVALIGDSDARELARRCFRLSEIFLEEENRRG